MGASQTKHHRESGAQRPFRGYVYIQLDVLSVDDVVIAIPFSVSLLLFPGHGETSWCFSQVKGALNDDITDADVISCVEFNHDGDLLATGDKGGRVVIFQVSFSRDSVTFEAS